MKILAFDQGISHMGWSVIESEKKELINYGCFAANKKETSMTLPVRLFLCEKRVELLISEHKPDVVVTERLFYSSPGAGKRNKSSAIMNTNMITGVIMAVCGKKEVPYYNYSPLTVKKVICGNGKAEKKDVIGKIKKDYPVKCIKSNEEHICDSIAIAITHISASNLETKS